MLNELILSAVRSELNFYISGKRITHTLAVESEAVRLGQLFSLTNEDILQLRLAALLHDITKEKNLEEQILLCDRFGYQYTENDIACPKVFHSVTGAFLAREVYGEFVSDIVFDSIRFHTTGRPAMSMFEKLIYLADYIEETRTFPDCTKLRTIFYDTDNFTEQHLNKVLVTSYDMTISNLIEERKQIHPLTISARNFLLAKGTFYD